MVNAVVVGYGRSGRDFHCYLVGLTPGIHLYGVVSGSEEKRQNITQTHGCRAFPDLDDALADPDVQLIILATPNNTHADLAVKAMQAGKHVVTDKVMCLTLDDCERMISAAQANDVMLSVFQNRRFDGDYLTIRKLMVDGLLGEVRWLEMSWQTFRAWGGWRGVAAMGGGKLYDLGAHLIDQACLIFPDAIESVYCRMHHDYDNTDVESEALVVITFAGGQTAVCDFSSMAALSKPRFYVRGTKGTFRKFGLDPQEAAMSTGDIDAAVEPTEIYGTLSDGKEEYTIPTLPGRWRDYYENISAVLNDGAPPAVTYAELRREIAVIDAAFESARTNNVVTVDQPGI
ncbi:MAG: Gfo/Idh/MocA family oxidoreductase [Lentisphaerae bacterium]|jgi:scyllo-inositol 2-dehydrogenase (NADP+)|nr:Gfo/Idh/MocA family oxidoreductase [Lentisphaerota bacterium]MBT4814049.1 Gfo/Idh/MocA family oxidoreductase [Lentisphaerota bacterium]MBT5611709.1 Gfo/Idh/MocA family oxidoreductase [Lentisphaerota bacterium]MBT7060451.1 Gfo/Idh/MocA family oxidoreductase [Lentisphaerota bacterium]MBT7848454.1 Gfo/Idh/MocA family oxidoreductase [Lentisphaerota bacterium]